MPHRRQGTLSGPKHRTPRGAALTASLRLNLILTQFYSGSIYVQGAGLGHGCPQALIVHVFIGEDDAT